MRRCACVCVFVFGLVAIMHTQQPVAPQKADSVLILKKDHVMELLAGGKVIRSYKVALGQGGLAPKDRQGDGRTPEGLYVIDAHIPPSEYHLSLHVSNPYAEVL